MINIDKLLGSYVFEKTINEILFDDFILLNKSDKPLYLNKISNLNHNIIKVSTEDLKEMEKEFLLKLLLFDFYVDVLRWHLEIRSPFLIKNQTKDQFEKLINELEVISFESFSLIEKYKNKNNESIFDDFLILNNEINSLSKFEEIIKTHSDIDLNFKKIEDEKDFGKLYYFCLEVFYLFRANRILNH